MRVLKYWLIAILLFLGVPSLAPVSSNAAQATATPAATGAATPANPFNPNVVIVSPVIVSELHGQVNVTGTANLPNTRNYYLESRLLNEDGSVPSDSIAWVPASVPSSVPVQDGLLATWDTTKIADGVYELRLTVTTNDGPPTYFIVTPLRISNESAALTPNAGATQGASENLPRVTANVTTYLRTGDSQAFAVLAYMQAATGGIVLGVSSTGSGWYYVQLDNGLLGWVLPSAVTTAGDFSHVPPVVPPQLARRAATTAPAITLALNGIALNPSAPVCGGTFNVQVNVANAGTTPSAAVTINVQDIHSASGTVTASGSATVPALNPNANYVAVIPLTVTLYYNEAHVVRASVGNSQITVGYTLGQGACNKPPTATVASPTTVKASATPRTPTKTTVPASPTASNTPPSPTATLETPATAPAP